MHLQQFIENATHDQRVETNQTASSQRTFNLAALEGSDRGQSNRSGVEAKNTPFFQNNGGRVLQFKHPQAQHGEAQEADTWDNRGSFLQESIDFDMLSQLQVNFNQICGRLRRLQAEVDITVPNVPEPAIHILDQGKPIVPPLRINHSSSVSSPLKRNVGYSYKSSLAPSSAMTPRDGLKQEILGECLTFCQNQIKQHIKEVDSVTSSSRHGGYPSGAAFEERLKSIIEGWQKQFYEEYVEPKIKTEFQHLSQQLQ